MFPVAALSALLGRDGERARLAGLVGSRRLVTVVGPGGIGKTRLAADVCARDPGAFAGRVHSCELASVAARDDIGAEVAGQLGFPSLESLALGLGDEAALLLLDNCEHVLAATARLCGSLLEAVPALHVLATSREPLGLDGEELLVLGPLALPATEDRAGLEASPAVQLFAERARSGGAHTPGSTEELAVVAELCRRLDGVPLAIELAAARARSLTPAELLAHLDRRFDLLQRATPVGRARHRSLRAAIDTSYELLDAREQAFFRALGVFAGPFGVDLAHAVAAPPGCDRLGAIDLLSRLVDRSLVVAEPQRGATRYRLLDSLRHYAVERAAAVGEWEGTLARFVDAMGAEADRLVAQGRIRWSPDVLEAIYGQLGNFVAAIDQCLETDSDATRSFRLLLPLWGAIHQGRAAEVAEAAERVLARFPKGDEWLRAEALAVAANASLPAGRFERAEELAAQALQVPSVLELAPVIALRALGMAAHLRGDVATAADAFQRGAELAKKAGVAPFKRELVVCAAATTGSGDGLEKSLLALDRTSAEAAAADDAIGVVWAGVAKCQVLVRAGRLAEARRSLELADRARHGFAYPYGAMVTARLFAALEGLERGWRASRPAWSAAVDRIAAAGDLTELAVTLRAAAVLARREGDGKAAETLLAAVPAGIHASVIGDLFPDDPHEGRPREGRVAPAPGALRRVRELLTSRDEETPNAFRSDEASPRGQRGELRRAGDGWSVSFAGRSVQLRHLKGLADLAALLARPDEELHCLQLIGGSEVEGDAGPLLDERARRAYQARVRELQGEIDEARAANDPGRAERAEAELDAFVQQLSEAFGLGGRSRRGGSASERARSAVAWRIRAALKRIREVHPDLARHLENAVRTGTWCSYRPETAVEWQVQTSAHGRSS
jgi:predicted ATPase